MDRHMIFYRYEYRILIHRKGGGIDSDTKISTFRKDVTHDDIMQIMRVAHPDKSISVIGPERIFTLRPIGVN